MDRRNFFTGVASAAMIPMLAAAESAGAAAPVRNLRPATIPEVVAFAHGDALARPLKRMIRDILAGCDPFSDQNREFAFTDRHLRILRRARFLLDPAENTAPCLDPSRPFGTPNPLGDIGDAARAESWEDAARLYGEAQTAMILFFRHATLAPGEYFISNLSMRELAWISLDPSRPLAEILKEKGIAADRRFSFTQTHLALLRAVNWRWEGWNDHAFEENRVWPVVFVDAKRTYDVTAIQRALGWELDADQYGYHQMTRAQRDQLWAAHGEIQAAFQVFVEHAELKPGTYSRQG